MEKKIDKLDKERIKALGELLVAECKSPASNFTVLNNLIDAGADVLYKNSYGLYFAAKQLKFDLIRFLIDKGALNGTTAPNYITAMCEYKGFNDKCEAQYFELLELICNKSGKNISVFTPYINNMAVNGRLGKIIALKEKYGFSDTCIASAVYIRIIFEIISGGYNYMLDYINAHRVWADKTAFDLAVATNEWMALEYFIQETNFRIPSDTAVGQALFEGSFEVITILDKIGYDFKNKPLLLEKAGRAVFSNGTKSLEFLFSKGYSADDKYKGKTLYAHALDDKNEKLLEWLQYR